MKKIITLTLMLILAFSLAACSSNKNMGNIIYAFIGLIAITGIELNILGIGLEILFILYILSLRYII